MARYEISHTDEGLAIDVSEVGERREELLTAFGECQQGTCSCPTEEYEKLETMDVATSADAIAITLRPKAGAELDAGEIAACLDYTVMKAGR